MTTKLSSANLVKNWSIAKISSAKLVKIGPSRKLVPQNSFFFSFFFSFVFFFPAQLEDCKEGENEGKIFSTLHQVFINQSISITSFNIFFDCTVDFFVFFFEKTSYVFHCLLCFRSFCGIFRRFSFFLLFVY